MPTAETPPQPTDPERFRTALVQLLVRARAHGVEVCDTSWKCDPERDELAWDVEISRILPPGTEAD
jgi:hypothetical protein